MYDLAMDAERLAVVDRAEALFREGFNRSQSVLMARFEEWHGATACRELTRANLLDPVERQAAADRGTFTTLCPQLVRTAAMLVAEALAVPRTGE
jgi:uncharacterized protein YmfQ (DUF2313 family)